MVCQCWRVIFPGKCSIWWCWTVVFVAGAILVKFWGIAGRQHPKAHTKWASTVRFWISDAGIMLESSIYRRQHLTYFLFNFWSCIFWDSLKSRKIPAFSELGFLLLCWRVWCGERNDLSHVYACVCVHKCIDTVVGELYDSQVYKIVAGKVICEV